MFKGKEQVAKMRRAGRVVARRGGGPKTARLLASRGFGEETVSLVAGGGVAQEL